MFIVIQNNAIKISSILKVSIYKLQDYNSLSCCIEIITDSCHNESMTICRFEKSQFNDFLEMVKKINKTLNIELDVSNLKTFRG